MIPVDPRPLTLRQLLLMVEGTQRARWSRTSAVMALIANVNRDSRRSRPYRPSDFDPYESEASETTVLDKDGLRKLLTEASVPKRTMRKAP